MERVVARQGLLKAIQVEGIHILVELYVLPYEVRERAIGRRATACMSTCMYVGDRYKRSQCSSFTWLLPTLKISLLVSNGEFEIQDSNHWGK